MIGLCVGARIDTRRPQRALGFDHVRYRDRTFASVTLVEECQHQLFISTADHTHAYCVMRAEVFADYVSGLWTISNGEYLASVDKLPHLCSTDVA